MNINHQKQPVTKKTAAPRKQGPKKPKKITETYLHNAGLYYLQRFSASKGQFREVMGRKIKKSCAYHTDQSLEICEQLLETLVTNFENVGLLDDKVYTKAVIASMRRNGKSKRMIFNKLRAKHIPQEMASEELQLYDRENGPPDEEVTNEQQAALIFARKKRIGPYNTSDKASFEKDLARMARAGFDYQTCLTVMNTEIDRI